MIQSGQSWDGGIQREGLTQLEGQGGLPGGGAVSAESEVLVAQSCPTLCNPIDRSPPGSSVHEILQARILDWVAMPFSRGSSQLRDRTQVSHIAGRFFIT